MVGILRVSLMTIASIHPPLMSEKEIYASMVLLLDFFATFEALKFRNMRGDLSW